ncbi:hypothetical protein PF008_g14920 [Phytophthora fragariae]|uniref:BZIP domain-containing protein n=1 Tax=Phytophthora fragariae TaxID=53985 RepID=A0A6G0RFL6_9STRA|nr:hypothetical protein PF008_g14920 [Phytophthora fragariae]
MDSSNRPRRDTMNASVLHPPNNWHLSDAVIGNVVQRARATPDLTRFSIAPSRLRTAEPQEPFQVRAWKKPRLTEVVQVGKAEPEPRSKVETTVNEKNTNSGNVASLIALGKESLREARRQNQRRYRKKQHDNMVSLEQETNKLQLQIEQLEQRRRAISPTVRGDDCYWSVVVEYFRLFKLGLMEQPSTQQLPSNATPAKDISSAQLNLLCSKLAQDVALNEGRGVDAVIYSWRRASFWFQDFRLELEDLHKEGANALVAVTKTSFTITERTLRNVFPGIWDDRESEAGYALVNKLLGQRIVMRGTTFFEWDPTRSLVSSLIAQSDLLTPVLRLLGCLKDVERVFGKAIISPDFHWTSSSLISCWGCIPSIVRFLG